MSNALELLGNEEFIPEYLINKYNLLPHTEAIKNIHFPENSELLQKAIQRLSFEELFLLRLGFCGLKNRNRGYTSKTVKPVSDEQILNIFPFPLTGAQKNVISQCQKDMSTNIPMNRLVQGDVGSGKTAVAAALCYSTVKSGYSAVVLAPTEILATQHYKTFCAFFEKEGFNISLLTGSLATKPKREIKEKLKNGQVDILIATHAVLTEDVVLNNTALIITDEQHRFGVAQRSVLGQKAVHPHTLVMSATPIPRTMGLIIYGDLDISIIDEIPKGRKPVKSYSIDSSKRDRALGYVKKHLDQGYQGYIVCPLIEEDENNNSSLKAATNYINDLKKGPLANYSIGLLHGKMRPKEKEAVMKAFASGELQLLVSTTVIEVGVDVPNAVIMMIENAERFGLSQLHQLRGRVGRGSADSCCIFVTDSNSKTTAERLKIITSTNDGFKIAEADLKLRGPGNFLGKEQHGLPRLKIADLLSDGEILNMASSAANDLLSKDKFLSDPRHLPLKIAVNTLFKKEKNIEFN
ncbi:MAG: ATP-dependent DNA helicase RecG [Clostridia bacterium]|nr:ATP-dependent DNA helicase RecG [Clostridia bacterium]